MSVTKNVKAEVTIKGQPGVVRFSGVTAVLCREAFLETHKCGQCVALKVPLSRPYTMCTSGRLKFT